MSHSINGNIKDLLPNDEDLIRNDGLWVNLIKRIEERAQGPSEENGMDLDDLVACCEAEDGSDVELTLDEFEPQCAEDVTNDHTERVTPEDRQLVLAGKAPHFQKSFLQSLQSVINIRLQELRDGKVILQFSANFERIQTNERFQEHNINKPGFQSTSRSYERSSDIQRQTTLPSPYIHNHHFGPKLDSNFKRNNQVHKTYRQNEPSQLFNHMKFKVREYEIDCRTSESLSTILNSIQSMSKFGNEATTVKVQKLCQNSEMKQICPAPTCEESHLDELNEREHNTPELVNVSVKFSVVEACDVANEDQSSDSCTNLALNSQIKLHDESGVKEGNISMTNSGSQDLELKTQHELDQSNFKLKDLSIVLKKCVVPELSGLNNSFKFEDNIIENENDKIRLKSQKQNILHNQKNQQNSEQQKNSSTSPIIPKQVFAQQNPIKPLRFDKENKTPIKRSKKRHTTNEIKDVSSAPAEDLSSKRSKSFSCKKQAITVSPVPTKNPTDKPIQPKGPKSRIEEGVSEGSIINPSSESKSSLDEPVQHSVTEYNERRKQILSLRDATSRSRELIVKKLRRDALAKPQTPISNFRIQDVFGSEDES